MRDRRDRNEMKPQNIAKEYPAPKTACEVYNEMLASRPITNINSYVQVSSACDRGMVVSPLSKNRNMLFIKPDLYENHCEQAKANTIAKQQAEQEYDEKYRVPEYL